MVKYVLFHGFKALLEMLLFFKFNVSAKILQWPFNRCLCLLVFCKKIAKQLWFLIDN